MACDICNCDDHPNRPCANCSNCIGHYQQTADYDEVHYDFSDDDASVTPKPHYKYCGKTGKITRVDDALTDEMIADSYGL